MRIAYTVVATLPDEETARDYLAWLRDGHVAAVVEGGAEEGVIVRIEDPATPIRVETRYVFPSREAYDRYVAETAPALRADGIERFGESVAFERRLGRIEA